MQSIIARRTVSLAPRNSALRVAGVRNFGDASAAASVAAKDIGAGLALGFIISGGWMLWARGQFKRMDTFNEKLRASKEE